jgi:hypothetical protein
MEDNSPKSRQIKNEQLIRDRNSRTKRHLKKFFHNDKTAVATPLNFICECSDLNCEDHVELSINQYEALHVRQDRFVVCEGHVTSSVEKIVDEGDGFVVVEKYALKA